MDVTIIIVNCRTPDLLRLSYDSVRSSYPAVDCIIVDNGQCPQSSSAARSFAKHPRTIAILNSGNVGHGAAMHQAIQHCSTAYAFTFDSDCEMLQPGVLELMLDKFADPNVYAIGVVLPLNEIGLAHVGGNHPCVHPAAMMLDAAKYRTLKPFIHHGSPTMLNMADAVAKGYELVHISEGVLNRYVRHKTKGTVNRLGDIPHWNPYSEARPERAKLPDRMIAKVKTEVVRG